MLINGKGFFVQKIFNVEQNHITSLSWDSFCKPVDEGKNIFIQLEPINLDESEALSKVTATYGIETILIRGGFYPDVNIEKKLDKAFADLINKNSFQSFKDVEGDYSLTIVCKDKLWVINGQCSQYEIFWKFDGEKFFASNYHNTIVDNNSINNQLLALLCYGEYVNIYNNLNILRPNSALLLDFKKRKCFVKDEIIKRKNLFSSNVTLDEIGEAVHSALVSSVKKSLHGHKKCVLMLSGGIDSGAVARCLYECNTDAVFFTWSSKNKRTSEFQYSKKVAEKLGYEVVEFVMDEPPYNYLFPKNSTPVYPHVHELCGWWEVAFEQAKMCGADVFFSGHHGSVFESNKSRIANTLDFWYDNRILDFVTDVKIDLAVNSKVAGNREPSIRGHDFFTHKAQQAIRNHLSFKIAPRMLTDHYCYLVNFCDNYNIAFEEAYLDSTILDITYSIPSKYKNKKYGGFEINKIPLRYSMIDRLPQEIVSRCYSANLGYAISANFKKQADYILSSFNEGSSLVRRNIIDMSNVRQLMQESEWTKEKNQASLISSFQIERWLKQNNL